MRLTLNKDLAPLRTAAKARVDAEAEQARLVVITPGSGQAMVYAQKYEEAVAFLADPTLTPNEVPHIFREVGITGDDPWQVAQVVVNMRHQWQLVSSSIEGARLEAKKRIDEAHTPAAIEAAAMIDWVALFAG